MNYRLPCHIGKWEVWSTPWKMSKTDIRLVWRYINKTKYYRLHLQIYRLSDLDKFVPNMGKETDKLCHPEVILMFDWRYASEIRRMSALDSRALCAERIDKVTYWAPVRAKKGVKTGQNFRIATWWEKIVALRRTSSGSKSFLKS